MNLIKQLGGYEAAKIRLSGSDKSLTYYQELNAELLEHRRQRNIFEVGDYVLRKDGFANVLKITAIDEGHADLIRKVDGEPRWSRFKLADIRHATDDEIKAGKRLEVK